MENIVILAGGKSSRMGRDKLSLELGGGTLLESAAARFSADFENVYISVADAAKYPGIQTGRVVDIIKGAGPLSGLHAALKALEGGIFLVAADMPFSSPRAARRIIELCTGYDAGIIKLDDGRYEPLFGYYTKTLLPRCEILLKSGDYRMTELFPDMNIRFIPPRELGDLWEDKLFLNVNYPEDYEKIINGVE